jgi:hypothetical protein
MIEPSVTLVILVMLVLPNQQRMDGLPNLC